MTTETLKPCPFCGSSHVHFVADTYSGMSHGGSVRCEDCLAEGVPCYSDEGASDAAGLLEINKRMAVDHWNTRR